MSSYIKVISQKGERGKTDEEDRCNLMKSYRREEAQSKIYMESTKMLKVHFSYSRQLDRMHDA